jgi:AbiV family abortive infection protein
MAVTQGLPPVSPQYLLEGAVYALEQCGLLLHDANLLYQNRAYASAIGLAAFAREELGRWRMLLDLRQKVIAGEKITVKQIQSHCDNHVRKQQAGMTSITMRTDRESGLGKLLQMRSTAVPGSKEWTKAQEEVDRLDRQKKKRTPEDRHRQRMSALYVDAVSVNHWNRPKEISRESAQDFLSDAVNDYAGQRSRYAELELIKDDDPELFKALVEWSGRPDLPPPQWPHSSVGRGQTMLTLLMIGAVVLIAFGLFT